MSELKPTRSRESTEDVLKNITAYKQKHPNEWNGTDLRNRDRDLYNLLERFREANGYTSRNEIVRELGHSFQRKERVLTKTPRRRNPPFDIAEFTEEISQLHTDYQKQGKPWNGSVMCRDDSSCYYKLSRLGNYWFMPKHGKKRISMAAEKLGIPFEYHATLQGLKNAIEAHITRPESQFQLRPIAELQQGTPAERALYHKLYYHARRKQQSKSYATLRKFVLDLGYKMPDLEAVERAGQKQFLNQKKEPKQPAEKADGWLEDDFNRLWLFAQFERIHPLDKATGQRAYTKPSHVNQKERTFIKWARRLFKNYEKAMEAWQRGTYKESLSRITKTAYPDALLEHEAREGLRPLMAQKGFVTREELRILHSREYNFVDTFRERKGLKSHGEALGCLGFSRTELTPDDRKASGHCGELFSLGLYYLLKRAGKEDITEIHPKHPSRRAAAFEENPVGKLEVRTSLDEKKVLLPDIARGNGQELRMTEIKTGGVFTAKTADDVLNHYAGELSLKDGEGIPVRFTDVHLHIPRKHIEKKVFEHFKDLTVLVAEDVALAYAQCRAPNELQQAYQEFVTTPWKTLDSDLETRLYGIITGIVPDEFKEVSDF